MKQVFVTLCCFCAFSSYAQNTSISSDKKIILAPLVVESTDASNPANIMVSTAVPLVGQKYETSQQHQLLLVPVGTTTASATVDAIMTSTATPLPASASTTSQASGLSLIPEN